MVEDTTKIHTHNLELPLIHLVTVVDCLFTAQVTQVQFRGFVQTTTKKINRILTLKIYPPLPLTSCYELEKVAFNAFATLKLGLPPRT